jgi:hypothetical protein
VADQTWPWAVSISLVHTPPPWWKLSLWSRGSPLGEVYRKRPELAAERGVVPGGARRGLTHEARRPGQAGDVLGGAADVGPVVKLELVDRVVVVEREPHLAADLGPGVVVGRGVVGVGADEAAVAGEGDRVRRDALFSVNLGAQAPDGVRDVELGGRGVVAMRPTAESTP